VGACTSAGRPRRVDVCVNVCKCGEDCCMCANVARTAGG
jgi:hypothetical protein